MLLILKDKIKSVSGTERTVRVLRKKLLRNNIPTDVSSLEEIELFIEKNDIKAFIGKKPLTSYKTIFFRRVGDKRNLAFVLSNVAKKHGILFLDNLYSLTNEPSKLKQTAVLALAGVAVPKTYYASLYDKKSLDNATKFLGLPMVIKVSKSKKGLGVFLARTKKEALKIIKNSPQDEVILQKFIPNNFDYRILVLGNKIACIIKRERLNKKDEFRNNVYLGASEEFLDISKVDPRIKNEAIKAAKVADIQVAGVDVVIDPRNIPYVFEVNRSPAFTFDEKISNEIGLLTDYLSQCYRKK